VSIHAGSIWIDANYSLVPKDIWVAVSARGTESEAHSYDDLLDNLVRLNIALGDVTIGYFAQAQGQQ